MRWAIRRTHIRGKKAKSVHRRSDDGQQKFARMKQIRGKNAMTQPHQNEKSSQRTKLEQNILVDGHILLVYECDQLQIQ